MLTESPGEWVQVGILSQAQQQQRKDFQRCCSVHQCHPVLRSKQHLFSSAAAFSATSSQNLPMSMNFSRTEIVHARHEPFSEPFLRHFLPSGDPGTRQAQSPALPCSQPCSLGICCAWGFAVLRGLLCSGVRCAWGVCCARGCWRRAQVPASSAQGQALLSCSAQCLVHW